MGGVNMDLVGHISISRFFDTDNQKFKMESMQ